MSSEGRVDVVIPLYNKRTHIRAALDSVLCQTSPPRSIIVVDDGSTDESVQLVEQVNDRRLALIKQSNQGPGAARNIGFGAGRAEFVAFLDADDEWTPTFLERCVDALDEHRDCALCNSSWFIEPTGASAVEMHRGHGITAGAWRCPQTLSAERLKQAVDFCHSSALVVRRSAVARLGGYFAKNHCTFGEDSYLFLRILLNFPVYRLMEPLIHFHTEASVLGIGRNAPYPEPPLLTYAEEVLTECPADYKELLQRYLAFYALFVGSRMVHQGEITKGLRLLLQRVSLQHLEREHRFRYARQVAKALGKSTRLFLTDPKAFSTSRTDD